MDIEGAIKKLKDEYRYAYEQAIRRKSMYMRDECRKIRDVLSLLGVEVSDLQAIREEVKAKFEAKQGSLRSKGIEIVYKDTTKL